ncbi:hypothetical protein L2E82_16380 [Cichorium intybus]|uniref:Uncharacterized protein n=1 Tax=Cichorium intybus TaxID=13427 RepID=A0ACB9F5U6_CICIN|nr:hypothetical protein L2E82_16380 [Cichorium intybus]
MKQYDNQHHRTIDESSESLFSQAGICVTQGALCSPTSPSSVLSNMKILTAAENSNGQSAKWKKGRLFGRVRVDKYVQ